MGVYREVAAQIDLPALEREVLTFWREQDVFHRSLAATADRPTWVFYEGPPTANGVPGAHHIEARVFKDVFPRFKTMQGFHVPRKAGWDCHGLPVELAVEKQLGFTGKRDIENYGIAEFNALCRESAVANVGEFERLTERMGYWVDMADAYWTMDADYIQSVWWSLKQIYRAGLLTEDHRVSPYCPRCGTGLSDHELAQGYEEITDPSVYVRFPLSGGELAQAYPGISLLVWTTTPWTLVSNTAVAVAPDATYVVAEHEGDFYIVAQDLLADTLGEGAQVVASFGGRTLERLPYERPFSLIEIPDAHYVVLGEYVTTDDGTGLVHQAPAFGADDLAVCREYGLPVVNPVNADGRFADGIELVGGEFFKSADEPLVADLRKRDLLFARRDYTHSYPHCWRCHTPLLYYAQPSWYIKTTAIKEQLLEANEETNWYPETIKWGRFGDWLQNNVDWALSRNRYWGTPLPIWRCADGHLSVVESLAELSDLAGTDLSALDPHRPYVDDVTFPCPECAQQARRVPEVIDVWFDSGAMPFAQWGYPAAGNEKFEQRYPADFICEAIDQTRGWFYTLMAVGELVFDQSAYRNVLCLGHILDSQGRKMSKHLGNVLDPFELMERHGADAVRWFMLAAGSAWQARRVGDETIGEVVRKTVLTYWNTVSFLSLYGRIAEFDPRSSDIPPAHLRPELDQWALSRSNRLVKEVTAALEQFDTQTAGRLIAESVDELSNWYVRRSRRRFWDGDPAALATLHTCLRTLTLLMAPFTPFITERVWQSLEVATDPSAPDSVHLGQWPQANEASINSDLEQHVDALRRLVELGRAARADSKVKTRQPLRRALVGAPDWSSMPASLVGQLCEELNVLTVIELDANGPDLVETTVKPNFRELGKRFAKRTPIVAKAVEAAAAAPLAEALRMQGTATVTTTDGEEVKVALSDVVITESPKQGWAVSAGNGQTVALDLAIDDELMILGVTRDIVRELQQLRKSNGFDVTDRIELSWTSTDASVRAAFETHGSAIATEVLAVAVSEADDAANESILDGRARVRVRRV